MIVCLTVLVTCKFKKDEDEDLRNDGDTRRIAKFIYPLHNNAKVFHFEAVVKDRANDNIVNRIRARIESKETARKKFDEATQNDQLAIMAALDEYASDSFVINLGAIPDNHTVKVEFSYFMELKNICNDDYLQTYRLYIPMVHKQRYVPNSRLSRYYGNGPEHNECQNSTSSPFAMKMYIKCQPEAKEIYGKLEAREGRNGHQVDRKIKHKRGRWVIVMGLIQLSGFEV